MRTVRVPGPFTRGLISDVPDWQVPDEGAVLLQDCVIREGVAGQRAGWVQEHTGITLDNTYGVAYADLALAGRAPVVAFGAEAGSELELEELSPTPATVWNSAGTDFNSGEVKFFPRAVYRDEVLFCHELGRYPMLRYSGGVTPPSTAASGTVTCSSGKNILTATSSWETDVSPGAYVRCTNAATLASPDVWARVTKRVSNSVVALEGHRAATTRASLTTPRLRSPSSIGFTYPCVVVSQAGTASATAATPSTVTGVGTNWNTGDTLVLGSVGGDGFMSLPSGSDCRVDNITGVSSDTSLTLAVSAGFTDLNYQILRRCPFKDVTVAHESLFGTGVLGRENTVFVGPPGWNPAFPPGETEPFDCFQGSHGGPNPGVYRLFEIDVPGPWDGDPNVGLLSAEGRVLVVKSQAVYAIDGYVYPEYSVTRLPSGDGNGAFLGNTLAVGQLPSGAFWAGRRGVFTYRGGQILNLTEGRISEEWRDLMSDDAAEAIIGEADQNLLVWAFPAGIANGSPTVYQLDLRAGAWSTVSNLGSVRFVWSAGADGKAYASVSAASYTIDLTAMYQDIDGGAYPATDEAGTGPAFDAQTGSGLGQEGGTIGGGANLVDLGVTVNFYVSTGSAPTVTVKHVAGGLLDDAGSADVTSTVMTISSDTNDRVDAYREAVGVAARRHAIRVTAGTSSQANVRRLEVHELSLHFRKMRDRT